jgi:hypothetical protein
MNPLKRNSGQFIPIATMVLFTMVVFMVAMVNIYKVSRAKLKAQNLADAAALNLAAQQAQAYNIVADRNEWMNHMVAGGETPTSGPNAPDNPCVGLDTRYLLGISCVEADARYHSVDTMKRSRHIFHSKSGTENYANVVKTVNDAQKLFVRAYNSFINGSGGGSSSLAGAGSMEELLKNDIPELKNDPSIQLFTWNDHSAEGSAVGAAQSLLGSREKMGGAGGGAAVKSLMQPLSFAVKNIHVARYRARCGQFPFIGWRCIKNQNIETGPLASVLYNSGGLSPDQYVGYMIPCDNGSGCFDNGKAMPKINTGGKTRTGVGVYVVKEVNLPGYGYYKVGARAKAYIVEGSGGSGRKNESNIHEIPRFSPTYWVKLAS